MPEVEAPPAPAPAPAPLTQPQRAAQTTVRVSELPQPTEPSKPPKAGSARARMSSELHKKFGGEEETRTPAAPKKPAEETLPPESKAAEEEAPPPKATEETPPAAETPPATDAKGKKVSPWKLVDQFKERAAKAEARALELEKAAIPEATLKDLATRMQAYEKRIADMTEDLRFHNAEKYDPDIQKITGEQTAAWNRAMKELNEISFTDPQSQQPRALTSDDLLELVKMPLGQARDVCDNLFGKFSDDVMAHRKAIRELFDQRSLKLEELKKTGATREQERMAKFQQGREQLQQFTRQTYAKANEEAAQDEKHGQFFRTREGESDADKEWNSRLEKGFKLVDEAYSANSTDPRLTPEQRATIIRKHAAVRNRAASWGALRYENERLQSEIARLEKDLKAYKQTTPAAGGRAGPAPKEELRGFHRLKSDLLKIAH